MSSKSLQELRNIEAKLTSTATILQSTLLILKSLEKLGRRLQKSQDTKRGSDGCTQPTSQVQGTCPSISTSQKQTVCDEDDDCVTPEIRALYLCSLRCQSYINSVTVMQSRASKLVGLVSELLSTLQSSILIPPKLVDLLDQRSQEVSAQINESTQSLTKKSVNDNKSILVVTVITLIYLPTQLVAVSRLRHEPYHSIGY